MQNIFEDRRGRMDRRDQTTESGMPKSICRRKRERRNILRQYHPQPWWLQTNYAEELNPPILDSASEPTPTSPTPPKSR
ncbi:MAG: hypothetical protein QM709_15025 [Spongiibacteraceae bacterium]